MAGQSQFIDNALMLIVGVLIGLVIARVFVMKKSAEGFEVSASCSNCGEIANVVCPPCKDVDMTNAVRGTSKKIPTVNLRDPVASQQRIMELTAQKIAAGMESAGYTPANVGLLQKLMAARGLK